MSPIAKTPEPPYYAVIFTSRRGVAEGYEQTAERMLELAAGMEGFLGVESVRGADGFGITVSYWRNEQAISAWKQQSEHAQAQHKGKNLWYDEYAVRVSRVERAYSSAETIR